jgi:hypothetical protein
MKNIASKLTQCDHHINLLEDHIMKGTTPRGLNSTIQPSVPCADTDLLIAWEKIKLDFQSKLLLTLAEYWKRYRSRLQKDDLKLEKQLKANSTDIEWQRIGEILDKVQHAAVERYKNKKKGPPQEQQQQARSRRGQGPGPGNSQRERPGEGNNTNSTRSNNRN